MQKCMFCGYNAPMNKIGRPLKNEGHPLVSRQIRFTDSQWEDVKYIGTDRVRKLVTRDADKKRKASEVQGEK